MKIIKHRLHIPGRRLPPIQTQPPPPLKKRALLIGIKTIREEKTEATEANGKENHKEENAKAAPKRKGKKKREGKVKEEVHEETVLKGSHHDALAMSKLLIDLYDYDAKNITILIDNDDPNQLQPTKANILQKMHELVDGANPGDRFFFHFSGHSTQLDTENPEEEDRKDELILTSDGKTIQDNELRALLVDSLPIGSTLVAVFDSCHSCTLLDLEHFRCNRVYVPWRNKGQRRTDPLRNAMMRHNANIDVSFRSVMQARRLSRNAITWKQTSIDQILSSPVTSGSGFDFTQPPPITTRTRKSLSISTNTVAAEPWYGNAGSPIVRCGSPEAIYCTGICRDDPSVRERFRPSADVISLSSSKDGQRTWEDEQGSSMTQALIKVLRNDPNPSLKDLLTLVSHEIHLFYLGLHEHAKKYKEQVRLYNDRKHREGRQTRKGKSVEMDNFQDPQISSAQPLDMSRRWHL